LGGLEKTKERKVNPRNFRNGLAATVALGICAGAVALPSAAHAQTVDRAMVQPVQYWGGYGPGPRWRGGYRGGPRYGYRGGGRWVGPAIGAGIAAAIIGGSLAAARNNYSDEWERCEEEFRSFRPSDGTYQPYGGGPRELCPYLRG